MLEKLKHTFEKVYREGAQSVEGKKLSLGEVDGTTYVNAEKNTFLKEDGTVASERDIFNSLVGKTISLPDGDVAIVKRLPGGKDMYNELYRRRPSYDGVKDVKQLNSDVNHNMEELITNSVVKASNVPDADGKHEANGITSFDTRTVKFYDGRNAYDILFSVAMLEDGQKVAYAKKFFRYDEELTKKIQAAEARSTSPLNQQPVSTGRVAQQDGKVNSKNSLSAAVDFRDAQLVNIMASNVVNEARASGIDLSAYYRATGHINAFQPSNADIAEIADAIEPIVAQLGNSAYSGYVQKVRDVASKYDRKYSLSNSNTDAKGTTKGILDAPVNVAALPTKRTTRVTKKVTGADVPPPAAGKKRVLGQDVPPPAAQNVPAQEAAANSATTEPVVNNTTAAQENVSAAQKPPAAVRKVPAGRKERSYPGTASESPVVDRQILPDDLEEAARTYQPVPNQKGIDNANATIGRVGYEGAIAYLDKKFTDEEVSLDDIILGERLIQEAMVRGDRENAIDLIQKVAVLGTELGQKVQALSVIQRLTPEGQLKMLLRVVERGKSRNDPAFNGVEVTQDIVEDIQSAYDADGTFDQDKLNAAVERSKQKIANQMKVTVWEKVNAWRYLSMLGNAKTHDRNIVSNVANLAAIEAKNVTARTIETVANPKSGRTKTWERASTAVKEHAREVYEKIGGMPNGKYTDGVASDIKKKRKIFKSKAFSWADWLSKTNSKLMEAEDRIFSRIAFIRSYQEYLTANGIRSQADIDNNPDLLTAGQEYAIKQAKIATFQQDSKLANAITRLGKTSPAAQLAVDAVFPFKKTPMPREPQKAFWTHL